MITIVFLLIGLGVFMWGFAQFLELFRPRK